MSQWSFRSATELSEMLKGGAVTSMDLTTAALDRIATFDPEYHAFISVTAEGALRRAAEADEEIRKGVIRGPLHGIPYSVKDLIEVQGVCTTMGSRLFESEMSQQSAEVIRRLDGAGAVLLGKNNTNEFAMGGTQVHPHGLPLNPWSSDLSVGGSSHGSGVAVASGMSVFSLGTDTGGSVRAPAALCGIYGFKPSFGRVSRRGVWPLRWANDTVGVLARSAADVTLVAATLFGEDPQDPTTRHADHKAPPHEKAELRGLRVGVIREITGIDSGENQSLGRFISFLEDRGVLVDEVSIPEVEHSGALFLMTRDVDHQLLQFDLSAIKDSIDTNSWLNLVTASLMPTAWVSKATKILSYIRSQLRTAMDSRDAFLWVRGDGQAALQRPAPDFADADDVIEKYFRTRNASAFMNIAGGPALAIPVGVSAENRPTSLQVGAAMDKDHVVLSIARAWEEEMGELPIPPMSPASN